VARRLLESASQLAGDRRAVSEVLGGILLFALLISVLVLVQANAVPVQNQQIEFEHNQRIQQDMLALDRAILQAATENVPSSAQLELSARYPSRFFLINPAEGSGSIETVGSGTVMLSNAVAPSAGTYWDGSAKSFDTTVLRYRPNYNEYRNAPVTVYEHNTLVNEFEDEAIIPLDSGGFIQGDQLTILLIDGRLSTASAQTVAVEATPLSAPTQTTAITNDGSSGITVSLPTTLSEQQWETLLDDETVAAGGNVTDVTVVTGAPMNTLTVTLAPGEYDLRMARVGVGSGTDRSVLGPHYLTAADEGAAESLRPGETRALTVTVRDRFNNPQAGAVTFETSGGSFRLADGATQPTSVTVATDEGGSASVTFVPDRSFQGTTAITASQDFDGSGVIEARERAAFTVTVTSGTTGYDPNDPNGVAGVNPGTPGSVRLDGVALTGNTVTLDLHNTASVTREVARMRLAFYLANSGQIVSYGLINTRPGDRIELYGDWDSIDQTISIPPGSTVPVDIRFSPQANPGDFFGVAVEYNGDFANYYVQVPPN